VIHTGCHEVDNCANETPEVADTFEDCCARSSVVSFGNSSENCQVCLSML